MPVCARCGKEFDYPIYYIQTVSAARNGIPLIRDYHFCPECAHRFRAILDRFLREG